MQCSTPLRCKAQAWVVVLLTALPSQRAAAEPPVDPAREHMAQAQKEYDVGHFDTALQGYVEAYRLRPLPGFLFNIAQCHRQLGHYEQAAFFYGRYLDTAGHPPNARIARELLEEVLTRQATQERTRSALQAATDLDHLGIGAVPIQPPYAPQLPRAEPEVKSAPQPLVKQWWFWAGIGVIAAGAVAVTYVATAPRPLTATLGTINDR